MALLNISELRVAFDEPPLLDHVGLNVERGERICLLGRNGTGKSTLMKCIVGDFEQDGGEIARHIVSLPYVHEKAGHGDMAKTLPALHLHPKQVQ